VSRFVVAHSFVCLIGAVSAFAQAPKKQGTVLTPSQASSSGPAATVAQCEALRHHGNPDQRNCYQRLVLSPDPALQAEGWWGLGDLKAANEAFLVALKTRAKDPEVWTRRGRLFLDHAEPAGAADWFGKALEIKEDYAPAILGLALVAADGFEGKASELAHRALTLDPKLVEAQELIARVALEDNNPEKAEAEAKKAVEMSPEALNAMAILATVDWLNDKPNSPWMDRALKINPTYGEGYETAAHFFVINRRYDEGIKAYRKALELKPDLWSARSELGINLMRFGEVEEARKDLEECFNAGYKNAGTVNSLRLLDTFKNYDTFKTPTTVLILNKKESALLRPYFQSELDRDV
jgi:cellulose synthase operon protein C